jgi:hypothetical protein
MAITRIFIEIRFPPKQYCNKARLYTIRSDKTIFVHKKFIFLIALMHPLLQASPLAG